MEITLQHTDAIYKTFFIMIILLPIPFSIPAIIQLIKCKYEFKEYELKYKLLWILPVIVILFVFFTTGLYMIDYALDNRDVQIVKIDEVDINNGGCNLLSGRMKFHVSVQGYLGDNFSDFMKNEVEDNLCEIESYKNSNEVIRIKVLD